MKEKDPTMTLISVKLQKSMHQALKKLCEERNMTMTDLVRHLIVMELRKAKEANLRNQN